MEELREGSSSSTLPFEKNFEFFWSRIKLGCPTQREEN
jgi:hypothetical protein